MKRITKRITTPKSYPTPHVGDVINGWLLKAIAGRASSEQILFVTVCPVCKGEAPRTSSQVRVTRSCKACAAKNHAKAVSRGHQKNKHKNYVRKPCCLDRACWVCAGTNSRVEFE